MTEKIKTETERGFLEVHFTIVVQYKRISIILGNMNYRNRVIDAYKTLSSDQKKEPAPPASEPSGFLKLAQEKADYSKIAKFLLLLGKEEAVKVLKKLSAEEVEMISQEISHTKCVDKGEAEGLLREFGFDKEREALGATGGPDAAGEILKKAFGKEEAERYLSKLTPLVSEKPFSFLNDLDFHQLILLMKDESVQVMGLIFLYLDPGLSSKILKTLSQAERTTIIKRIARGGPASMEVIQGMEDSLKEKIRTQGNVKSEEIDGSSALAKILKYMPVEEEQKILQALERENSDLSRDIKEKLFTIDRFSP